MLDYLDEKKQELTSIGADMKTLLPQLESLQSGFENPEAKVYVGYQGLRSAFENILQTLKFGEEYVGFLATLREQKDPITHNIFVKYHERRYEKGIRARLVGGAEMRPLFKKYPYKNYKLFEIRFVPQKTLSNILIFGDNIYLYTGYRNPIGFVLTSRDLAEVFREFFHYSWKISKP